MKIATHPHPPKKVTPSFPATPLPSKSWGPVKPSPFWKFGWRFNPPQQKGWGGGGSHNVQGMELHEKMKFFGMQESWLDATQRQKVPNDSGI